jgi:glycosyltransferase involved in cell wall biosynthesis
VAAALAEAGDTVTVFCPASRNLGKVDEPPGVEVVMLADVYGSIGRRTIDQRLSDERLGRGSSRILVQYVPTGFGLRGANIPWCRWLLERRRRHGDDVRVMFHEPYFEFTWSPIRQNALAVAERLMARMLLRAASRVYLSTDAWRRYLALHTTGVGPRDFVTLPIPSAVPRYDRPADVVERRKQLLGSSAHQLVGHFGTFGSEVAPMLTAVLTSLMEHGAGIRAVCVGSGSDAFVRSLDDAAPTLRGRAIATGRVSARDAALVLRSCDLLLQPYPDGVTTRRTSIMAGLINARAIVTTTGHLTEPVWADTGAVALAAARDSGSFVSVAQALLSDEKTREALAARGEQVYLERFALAHTIRTLRGALEGAAA